MVVALVVVTVVVVAVVGVVVRWTIISKNPYQPKCPGRSRDLIAITFDSKLFPLKSIVFPNNSFMPIMCTAIILLSGYDLPNHVELQ